MAFPTAWTERDLTGLPEAHLKGLAAIVKGRVNMSLQEVMRRYHLEAAVDGRAVAREAKNVVLQLVMDHATDQLIARVTADVEMLMDAEAVRRATEADKAAAEKAKAEAEVFRAKMSGRDLELKAQIAEGQARVAASEARIAEEVDARWRKKEGELSRKITDADKRIAAAEETARARIKAEVGVVQVVARWLRSFTTLVLDDSQKRFSLLELS